MKKKLNLSVNKYRVERKNPAKACPDTYTETNIGGKYLI